MAGDDIISASNARRLLMTASPPAKAVTLPALATSRPATAPANSEQDGPSDDGNGDVVVIPATAAALGETKDCPVPLTPKETKGSWVMYDCQKEPGLERFAAKRIQHDTDERQMRAVGHRHDHAATPEDWPRQTT